MGVGVGVGSGVEEGAGGVKTLLKMLVGTEPTFTGTEVEAASEEDATAVLLEEGAGRAAQRLEEERLRESRFFGKMSGTATFAAGAATLAAKALWW